MKQLISIVSPHTYFRWVLQSKGPRPKEGPSPREPGRPRTPDKIRDLIVRITTDKALPANDVALSCRRLWWRASDRHISQPLMWPFLMITAQERQHDVIETLAIRTQGPLFVAPSPPVPAITGAY